MSKNKNQGTAWETAVVKAAEAAGLTARRLAEGGLYDKGDVEIVGIRTTPIGHAVEIKNCVYIIECKARANLNVHAELVNAQKKAGDNPAAVAWKKLTRKQGNTLRTPDGPPVYVISEDLFLKLIGGR